MNQQYEHDAEPSAPGAALDAAPGAMPSSVSGAVPGATAPVRADLLGFSFHLAWLCLFMYDTMPGFLSYYTEGYNPFNPIYLFSMVSLVAALVYGILRTRSFMQFARSKAGAFGAPVACTAGTLCYTLCDLGAIASNVALPFYIAGGVLTGASSAVMAAHWASVFGRARAKAFILNFTLILVVTLLACLAMTYLFPAVGVVAATLLPLASGACLIYADSRAVGAKRSTELPKVRRRGRSVYAALIAGVAVLGFSTACLNELSVSNVALDQAFAVVTTVIVLAVVGWLISKEERGALVPLFFAPLAMLLVFALPFIRFTGNGATDVFYITGNVTIELMLLFAAVLFALLFDFSCARTYMIARVSMAVSNFAGSFVANLILVRGGSELALQVAGTAILVGSEVVVGALLLTYLLLRKKALPSPELNKQAAGVDGRADGIEGASLADSEGDRSTGATAQGGVTVRVQTAQEQRFTQGSTTCGSTAAATSPTSAATVTADPTDALVAATAERCGLSPREADVLQLLVAGDSTAQIQDKLCIAPGTFNYHMRNIYAKLGVHSRQELLVNIYNAHNACNQPKQ